MQPKGLFFIERLLKQIQNTFNMKLISPCIWLLLLSSSLLAEEQILIKTSLVESTKVIPHDLDKVATTKDMDLMAAPTVTTGIGKQASVEVIRDCEPPTVAPGAFEAISTGVIMRVTPFLKDGQMSFTAHLTVSEQLDTKTAEKQTSTELVSRDLHFSGAPKDGEPLWFDFTQPRNGKRMAVCLRLMRKDD